VPRDTIKAFYTEVRRGKGSPRRPEPRWWQSPGNSLLVSIRLSSPSTRKRYPPSAKYRISRVISEWRARSNRNGGRDHSGMVGDIERNQQVLTIDHEARVFRSTSPDILGAESSLVGASPNFHGVQHCHRCRVDSSCLPDVRARTVREPPAGQLFLV